LPAARLLIDLPQIKARGKSTPELDALIRETIDQYVNPHDRSKGIDDQIVRLVAWDVPRHVARELDHKALREYKKRALHFNLDLRRPETVRMHGTGAPSRRPSLIDLVRDKLGSRIVEGDVDRDALVELGLRYLRDVSETAALAPSAEMAE
jgi:hypothetical protein